MSTVTFDHTVTMSLNMFLDDVADFPISLAGLYNFDCFTQRFVRYFD